MWLRLCCFWNPLKHPCCRFNTLRSNFEAQHNRQAGEACSPLEGRAVRCEEVDATQAQQQCTEPTAGWRAAWQRGGRKSPRDREREQRKKRYYMERRVSPFRVGLRIDTRRKAADIISNKVATGNNSADLPETREQPTPPPLHHLPPSGDAPTEANVMYLTLPTSSKA